jgi:segregation and condensation protein A
MAAQMLLQRQTIEEAVLSNPALKEFKNQEGTEPEMAADVVDLMRTFQQIIDRQRQRPMISVDEDAVTVTQMIDYFRRRLNIEERPVRLKSLLRALQTRNALVCAFLALLEMVRLQAIMLRQESVFGEIVIKKSANFEQVMTEQAEVRDDWK